MGATSNPVDAGRHQVLGGTLVGSAAALAPGVIRWGLSAAKSSKKPANTINRWGLMIDTVQCAKGCDACERAGHRAVLFGDLRDPDSDISVRVGSVPVQQLRDDLQLDTSVRYEGL